MNYYNGGEEFMWMRVKDAQQEAETRRLLREARRARPSRGGSGGRLRRWLSVLAT